MSANEILGALIVALVSLTSLFFAIYKPLNENTKAMTELSVRIEQLKGAMDKQEQEVKDYKEHVSEGQKRQWDKINDHETRLTMLENKKEI